MKKTLGRIFSVLFALTVAAPVFFASCAGDRPPEETSAPVPETEAPAPETEAPQPKPENPTDGLRVWYKFDETEGNVAKDSSGNGYDAALFGGAEWITTSDGRGVALRLDNRTKKGEYAEIPAEAMESVTDDFTVSVWVRVEEAKSLARIFDFGTASSGAMFLTGGRYLFRMDDDTNKTLCPPQSSYKADQDGYMASTLYPEEFSEPRWQHVTVTRREKETTLWINGYRWASGSFAAKPRTGGDYRFYLGRSVREGDPYATLSLKDLRIYDRALSVAEINAAMLCGDWEDETAVRYAIDSLLLPDLGNVRENLYLPLTVNDRVKVEWSSDDRAVLDAQGCVGAIRRPEAGGEPAKAKLTGTFSCGEYAESVSYDVTVLPKAAGGTAYTLRVDAAEVLHPVSPMMYGVFFEDISWAGDGGLYPELLRNTCFHDSASSVPYWYLHTAGGAAGRIALDKTNNLNAAQFRHLKLVISAMPEGGCVGIRNEGYNGMELEKGSGYRLTFFARSDGFSGAVSAKLLSATGETISATATAGKLTAEWKQYSLTLTPEEYAAQGQLLLFCEGSAGAVHFDVVSLFPEDVFGKSGLRRDIAESIRALNPAFLRFPGGCYIEGRTLAQSFYWKNTLYRKEDRAGHDNIWGYRVTDGLGYYEFLLLCEDLGCEPLYVCGVGIAHSQNEDWKPWVRDALDAIEFANGDVTTTWGKVRAEMGHPEPFGLKYVEIGNEANFQMARYEERYQDFYDAIKAAYPDITLIADCALPGKPVDMIDLHHYNDPDWFLNNAYLFDGYKRGGASIYIGEYAAARKQGLQNLHAALGEAAYMIGLERNSDLVRMASFAPLLANPNHQSWCAAASFFDSSRFYSTPSYYVQQMFAGHLGDELLSSALITGDGGEDASLLSGGAGLGTWNTGVTYSSVKVTSNRDGAVLFDGDTAGSGAWKKGKGQWTAKDGTFTQTQIATDCRLWVDGADWTDYTFEVTARKNSGKEAFLLLLCYQDPNNLYYVNIGGWNNTKSGVQRIEKGVKTAVTELVPGAFETGRDYRIKVVVAGNRMTVYVDGERLLEYVKNDVSGSPLTYAAERDGETGAILIKAVNGSDRDCTVKIRILGAPGLASQAKATVMTAADKYAENSFDLPRNVAPVTLSVSGVSEEFEYTFMRSSVTVLEIGRDR